MKVGDFVYWINRWGEHIPGRILEIRRTPFRGIPLVRVHLNDLHGDRVTWVKQKSLEAQS